MNIEEEIFKKCTIDFEKLIPYGFKKDSDKFTLSKSILDNSFRTDIVIQENGSISGKIYDLSFDEEYTNFRVSSQMGKFVSKIREEFESILIDIRDNCSIKHYFIKDQSNRIANSIIKTYKDTPEFLWTKFPGYGIFRNPTNDKWYALIMNIDKSKIDDDTGEIEVINLKLDEEKIRKLLKRKGFYKAYHMNKENWITIILDETLKDEEIMNLVEESHSFTTKTTEWIIPANPKYYDVINCFNDTDTILWKQSSNVNPKDIVYLYVAAPYSAILYKCEVLEVNIPYEYKDKSLSMEKVMRIKLLNTYDKDKFTFDILKKYGINAIRGPRTVPLELSKEINK